ncbi:MAG: S-adenosylmethionine:tRNA ribosyltransferase-isomerase [Bacteroidales bacterium]
MNPIQSSNGLPSSIQKQIPAVLPEEYEYVLPPEKIARYPLEERDRSKLLVYRKGEIRNSRFRDLTDYLPGGCMLVRNDTRVIRARLLFHKPTGARIEVFLLDPVDPPDYQQVFSRTGSCRWKCIVGNARKWKEKELTLEIPMQQDTCTLRAEKEAGAKGTFHVRFRWAGGYSFGEVLDRAGIIPIPPYLQRESEDIDGERYQTVYSRIPGSVAAPTAGLHFTESVDASVRRKKIPVVSLTLHVGAGTFKPVKGKDLRSHAMHAEHFSLTKPALEKLYRHTGTTLAVGTTSVRTLESLYWIGNSLTEKKEPEYPFHLEQWDAYNATPKVSSKQALKNLLCWLDRHGLERLEGSTRIMIVPGYIFQVVNGLITNFHMPRSSLIMLVAAFTGNDWRKIYQHALKEGYRFLSYGDSSLLLP